VEKYQKSQGDEWQLATFLPYYVVLVSLVLFAATAAYALFRTIRTRFERANERLESLPYE
jgi:hypothetical protein